MQRVRVYDDSGEIEAVWFNQPFLEVVFKKDKEVFLAGKLNIKSKKPQLSNPEYEVPNEGEKTTHIARITPVYSLTSGIKQKWLRAKIKWLADKVDYIIDLKETLPDNIIKNYKLLDLKSALQNIHYPDNQENLKLSKDRLGFEELLEIQLKLAEDRKKQKNRIGPTFKSDLNNTLKQFKKSLPFTPTNDQIKVIEDIIEDFQQINPTQRLVQGDVGSGKTLIAIVAALITIKNGYKAAIMAPTTVLAQQLYSNFRELLKEFNINPLLLTSDSKKDIKKIQDDIEKENLYVKNLNELTDSDRKGINLIIGTHSLLFQEDSMLSNLGLVVIDEQHRFGVEQRQKLLTESGLQNSKIYPHYIIMTATPIPRTLAVTLFGNMKVSQINEKPSNRKDVKTFLVPSKKREDSYNWIKNEIKKGNQAFWICPLIEESEKIQSKSAKKTYDELNNIYPDLKIKLLHGKLKDTTKQNILNDFRNKKFNILVSTSVIEVGIDIPDANIIIIEGSERFGLAQLHQLRGRVGRSGGQGYCFLFLSEEYEKAKDITERLDFFRKETNGLKIAEYDLARRGPGEVYGTKQSGIPTLKIARLDDIELVKKTKEAAEILINK